MAGVYGFVGQRVMATEIHFVDVGQGNMVLLQASSGERFVIDCNITDENENRVLNYVANVFGVGALIYSFICTHRDADHIRGISKLHHHFPIQRVWDSGYPGTSTDTSEYRTYMNLRRSVPNAVKQKLTRQDFGYTRLRYLSAADDRLEKNANAQGIVIKVEELDASKSAALASAILPGDSDAETWRLAIIPDYGTGDISSNIFMAAHHGSLSFFDDDGYSSKYYYQNHIKAIAPDMTIVSVGPNSHGHPKEKAIEMYAENSKGSNKGNKVARTDHRGTMHLTLKSEGGWNLKYAG